MFNSRIKCGNAAGTTIVLASIVTALAVARAEEDLNVLPTEIAGGPTRHMLSRYLEDKAHKALARRREAYEALETPDQIAAYQERLREFFLDQLNLPERTPLNAKIVGTIVGKGYRIEKIIFESLPGNYVTALLYLPDGAPPYPAVLMPCGHTANGKIGYQKPCIFLAKMGIVAFCYDPIGQGERYQILDEAGKPRFKSTDEHTLVGGSCIPLGRNTATYRVWDGMRALDYLCSRDDMDAERIGCTGNSGGGTLTEYLMALEPRIVAAAPGCSVTTFDRRIETIGPGDAEQNIFGQIAFGMDHGDYLIMRAPRPTLICAATHDFVDIHGAWDIFREAKRLYTRMGYPERVDLVEADAKHGFSQPLREGMVHWMRRWLLEIDEPVREPEIETHSPAALLCSDKGQVLLLPGARSIAEINAQFDEKLADDRRRMWLRENRVETLDEVRRIAGIRALKEIPRPQIETFEPIKRDEYTIGRVVLKYADQPIWLPGLLFQPEQPNGRRILYLSGEGKQVDAHPGGALEKLVGQGCTVFAADLRGTGETGAGHQPMWGGNWDDFFHAYLLGESIVGMRAEDILVAARYLSELGNDGAPVNVELSAGGVATAPAIHAAALESKRFASLQLRDNFPSWSKSVRNPSIAGVLASTVHGALKVYDLPDLLKVYQEANHTR